MLRPKLENLQIPIGNCLLKRSDSGAELILGNQKSFSITLPESCILEALIKNERQMSTKEELIIAAWGSPEIIGPNSLPVAITNLRKVLELDNIKIINIPRKGYKIHLPEFELSIEREKPQELLKFSTLQGRKEKESRGQPHFYQWLYTGVSSTALALVILSYFYFWHTFDFVKVNINDQSSQICLTEKNELELLIANNKE
ncbi:OmpR/PhoB-type domain-containing protein [Vibrio chagasii]|nr:OmpR/PhoB-type domain-containing protein [Vibrio chagasii]CAH7171643.1 OmpR/PhoB-type domain-containing protein [Vibrio chagasii]CAH7228945.1 OmpR/PhoB-type domain-containing protein [Vibrio chagasii]CAH7265601.1 OmpR/PhoB-type domain-containing protein [Vibrio chagasii]CAH7280475.1 OmpR/PhoB-type domain-containing protein [Vibrio chagasii]